MHAFRSVFNLISPLISLYFSLFLFISPFSSFINKLANLHLDYVRFIALLVSGRRKRQYESAKHEKRKQSIVDYSGIRSNWIGFDELCSPFRHVFILHLYINIHIIT